jgi:hypothetical protein
MKIEKNITATLKRELDKRGELCEMFCRNRYSKDGPCKVI